MRITIWNKKGPGQYWKLSYYTIFWILRSLAWLLMYWYLIIKLLLLVYSIRSIQYIINLKLISERTSTISVRCLYFTVISEGENFFLSVLFGLVEDKKQVENRKKSYVRTWRKTMWEGVELLVYTQLFQSCMNLMKRNEGVFLLVRTQLFQSCVNVMKINEEVHLYLITKRYPSIYPY